MKKQRDKGPTKIDRDVNALAWDAGNRHAEARGARKISEGRYVGQRKWSATDYRAACREANRLFAALGFPQG